MPHLTFIYLFIYLVVFLVRVTNETACTGTQSYVYVGLVYVSKLLYIFSIQKVRVTILNRIKAHPEEFQNSRWQIQYGGHNPNPITVTVPKLNETS